ncbi:hypothetical protein [Amaricoccus sp. W119]|uniref:hypothetical protein n=1 Tax=Amaricoccus sp. W119 TaxID=3391833 RepID=UPI0039A5BB9E
MARFVSGLAFGAISALVPVRRLGGRSVMLPRFAGGARPAAQVAPGNPAGIRLYGSRGGLGWAGLADRP